MSGPAHDGREGVCLGVWVLLTSVDVWACRCVCVCVDLHAMGVTAVLVRRVKAHPKPLSSPSGVGARKDKQRAGLRVRIPRLRQSTGSIRIETGHDWGRVDRQVIH